VIFLLGVVWFFIEAKKIFWSKNKTTTKIISSSNKKTTTPKLPNGPVVGIVKKLFVYPIKSCGGIEVPKAGISNSGFECDRRWVLANVKDGESRFVSQRKYPNMTKICLSFQSDHLHLDAPGMETFRLPLTGINISGSPPPKSVGIWNDTVLGVDEGDEISAWFMKYLNPTEDLLRLMRIAGIRKLEKELRQSDSKNRITWVDKYPFLLTNERSLQAVGEMVGDSSLVMKRFRPNIVVDAKEPWAEERWGTIQVGPAVLRVVEGCPRCKVPTIDPDTGNFDPKEEPTRTINEKPKNPTIFGQGMMHTTDSVGMEIKVGMEIQLLEKPKEE